MFSKIVLRTLFENRKIQIFHFPNFIISYVSLPIEKSDFQGAHSSRFMYRFRNFEAWLVTRPDKNACQINNYKNETGVFPKSKGSKEMFIVYSNTKVSFYKFSCLFSRRPSESYNMCIYILEVVLISLIKPLLFFGV